MASSIVSSAAQKLGNLLVEEAKYLYKVREKVEKLQTELEWMECFLRDADTQQHKEKVICKWVSQVRDIAYDAEDVIQRYLYQVSHHRGDGFRNTLKWFARIVYTCDAWTLHNLGSEIEDMTIDISDLTSRLQRYGIQIIKPTTSLEYNPMSREERRTYSHIEEDVVGLKKDIQQVVDQVLNESVNVVGISGIGGLGKTTLARKVFTNEAIQGHFNNNCVWVYISQEFEKTRIFQEILNGLNNDDIWTDDAWERLAPAFQSIKSSTSKVLLTSRKQDLLKYVDSPGYPHPLNSLSDEDSWQLLKRKAFIDDGDVEREKLGREMLTHCDGLPLAIIALGGILSTKRTIPEWNDVQQNISSYLMSGDQGHENGRISEVLELSYHDLPFYLKPCFLYLGNFPEDYEISTQRLYHLWEAEGLLVTVGGKGGGTSYDVGETYLNELVQRSMVQVGECWTSGRIKTCKVHDVMREMCLKKCGEINFLSTVEWTKWDMASILASTCSSSSDNKKLRRFAVHWKGDDIFESRDSNPAAVNKGVEKKATCVRSVLVFPPYVKRKYAKRMSGKTSWKPFPLLRVLDLEGGVIEGLVNGFQHLIHLRYLSLRYTYIGGVAPRVFWGLKCLETLDLRFLLIGGEDKVKLDCDSFHTLERLRHLYLPSVFAVADAGKLSFPAACGMETLKNFDPSQCEVEELQKMTRLRVFSIASEYCFEEKDVFKCVLKAPVMKKPGQLINCMSFTLSARLIKEEPAILISLAAPPSSFKLTIQAPQDDDDVDVDDVSSTVFVDSLKQVEFSGTLGIGAACISALGRLPHLRSLSLFLTTILGGEVSFSAGSFPRLTDLKLYEPRNLNEWEVEDGAVPNLQTLFLQGCHKLKKLPRGLPDSVQVECRTPCIRGIEKYNTCPVWGC